MEVSDASSVNYPPDHCAGKSTGRSASSDCMAEMGDNFDKLVDRMKVTGELENRLAIFAAGGKGWNRSGSAP